MKYDPKAGQQFWEEVDRQGNKSKEQHKKQVFDEFDDFFQFKNDDHHAGPTRDDTKGADYKAEVTIEFLEAVKGVRAVRSSFFILKES